MPVLYHEGRFPPTALDLNMLFPLVGPANAAIARYEGVLAGIPNPDILLSPLTSREAVLSSKIEGTQVTLGEVLEFEAQGHLFEVQIPAPTARKIIRDFRDRGMLRELVPAAGRAPATFIFSELLNIAEGRQAF